jgi:hypothetical protein
LLEPDGEIPGSEFGAFVSDQVIAVGTMWLVTETTGSTFPFVGNMKKMEVFLTVPEFGIDRSIRESQHVFFVAFKTESILVFIFFEGDIELFRICPLQKFHIRRAVGVMTRRAIPVANRPMKHFFIIQRCRHFRMTFQTKVFSGQRKQGLDRGGMSGMTGQTTGGRLKRRMLVLGCSDLLPDFHVAGDTELTRHTLQQISGR